MGAANGMSPTEKQLQQRIESLERQVARLLELNGVTAAQAAWYRYDEATDAATKGDYSLLKQLSPKDVELAQQYERGKGQAA